MKATIDVESRKEADAIKAGLKDPAVRAFVQIVGILDPCSRRTQARILGYVKDSLEELSESSADDGERE